MRKIIRRYLTEVVVVAVGVTALALALGPGMSPAAQASSTTCQSVFPGAPPVRHVVRNGQSLDDWAHTHHADVSNILEVTVRCEGDDWDQPLFVGYLDNGNLRAPLPHGTVLWTHPLVIKAALTAYAVPQTSYYSADHAFCRAFPTNFIRARNSRATWAPRIPPTAPATRLPANIFSAWVKAHPHGTLAQSGHRFFNIWIRCYPVVR